MARLHFESMDGVLAVVYPGEDDSLERGSPARPDVLPNMIERRIRAETSTIWHNSISGSGHIFHPIITINNTTNI